MALSAIAVTATIAQITNQGIQVCDKIKQFYRKAKSAEKDVASLCNSIDILSNVLSLLKGAIQPPDVKVRWDESLNMALEKFKFALDAINKEITRFGGSSSRDIKWDMMKKLRYPSESEKLQNLKDEVDNAARLLNFIFNALELDISSGSYVAIEAGIEELHLRLDTLQDSLNAAGKRDRILNWLAESGYLKDSHITYINASNARQEGTGRWFLQGDHFYKWKMTPGAFLWLHGIAGCGKTVLSCSIIDNLRASYDSNPHVGLASFFFSNLHRDRRRSVRLIHLLLFALSAQFASCRNSVPYSLQNLYEKRLEATSTEDLKRALPEVIKGFRQAYIVFDGLDECPLADEERAKVLEFLRDLTTLHGMTLNILVTSRYENDIDESLRPLVKPSPPLGPFRIDAQNIEEDVRYYIRNRTGQCRAIQQYKTKIEHELMTKFGGSFLFVASQIEALERCPNEASVLKSLSSIPSSMFGSYDRVLEVLARPTQKYYRGYAAVALQWLSFALQPLSVDELAEAAIIEPVSRVPFDPRRRLTDADELVKSLGSLVMPFGTDSRLLRFIHLTVREFLIDSNEDLEPTPGRDVVFPKPLTEIESHQTIAKSCISYILYFSRLQSPASPSAASTQYPLIQYASQHWDVHASIVEATTGKLTDTILNFLLDHKASASWLRIRNPKISEQQALEQSLAPPIYLSSRFGFPRLVQKLLDAEGDVNAEGWNGESALHEACRFGHGKVVEILIARGADVNARNKNSCTPLHVALASENESKDQESIVEQLLQSGAEIEAEKPRGYRAIHLAAAAGNKSIVDILIRYHADVNAGVEQTPLQAASEFGHVEVVEALIAAGAKIDDTRGDGGSALQVASEYGNEKVVRFLLDHNADVNISGGRYFTPLTAASFAGHQTVVKLLLDNGADVNAPGGKEFDSALHAAKQGGHVDIQTLLLDPKYGAQTHRGMEDRRDSLPRSPYEEQMIRRYSRDDSSDGEIDS